MMRDHEFQPSAADPTHCGVRVPSTARYPSPSTVACWGLKKDHPTPDEVARLRRAFPARPAGGAA